MTKRNDIQFLRGIAVSGVFLFHLLPKQFPSGYLGVDVFFVISGYLLTPGIEAMILAKKDERKKLLKQFYLRRFFRLTPPLIATVLTFSTWMLLFGPLGDHRYVFIQGLTALLNLGNLEAFRLSQGNYFHPDPNALLHTWSLSAEEQVFVILPFALMLLTQLCKTSFRKSLVVVLTLGTLLYFTINFTELFSKVPFNLGSKEFFYFSPLFRISEFLIGSILVSSKKRVILPKYLHNILIVILCILFCFPQKNDISLVLTLLITVLLIAHSEKKAKSNLIKNSAIKIGDASYSIYLIHLPVIYTANYYLGGQNKNPLLLFASSVITTMLLSALSYIYIEGKFKYWLVQLNGDRRLIVIAGILIIPLFAMLSLRFGAVNYYGLSSPPTLVGTISCEKGGDIGYCGGPVSREKKNYLLIGDSHAAALSELFNSQVSEFGGNPVVMFGRGCPLSIEGLDLKKSARTPCQKYLKMVIDFTLKNKVVLVVAQRSSQDTWPNQDSTRNLIESVNLLSRSAEKIYLITPNPEFRNGMAQGRFTSLVDPNGFTSIQNMLPASFADGLLLESEFDRSKVTVINSTKLFCSKLKCSYKKNGNYLYWDSNHLSRRGADRYSNFFSTLNQDE